MKDLKLDDATASRRRAAANAVRAMPELASKIESGAIGLTNLSQAQWAIQREEARTKKTVSIEQKRDVIAQVEKLSVRKAEEKLAEIFPREAVPRDVVKFENADEVRIHATVSKETLKKLERLIEVLAHGIEKSDSNSDLAFVIDQAADALLKQVDPLAKVVKPRKNLSAENRSTALKAVRSSSLKTSRSQRQSIRPSFRNAVFRKYDGCCTHVDADGVHCGQRRFVQIEHAIGVAQGGTNAPENLTLLCRRHNLIRAERTLGREKMRAFFS